MKHPNIAVVGSELSALNAAVARLCVAIDAACVSSLETAAALVEADIERLNAESITIPLRKALSFPEYHTYAVIERQAYRGYMGNRRRYK